MSYTRAAQELFLTQSAISHGIRTLEEQLGTQLFKRNGRALQLTPSGRDMYRAVDEALSLIDSATERVVQPARRLAITIPVPIASMWLVPRLPRFTRLHPDVELRIAANNDTQDLERESLDLAIRHVRNDGSAAVPPGGQFLFDHLTLPVIAPDLLRKRPLGSLDDLSQHVLLHFETNTNGKPWPDWQWWLDAMKMRDVRAAGALHFSHYDQVVQAAVEGSGVALGRLPHLTKHLRDGSLIAPLGRNAVVPIGSFYVIVAARAPVDVTTEFVAWLKEEASEESSVSQQL